MSLRVGEGWLAPLSIHSFVLNGKNIIELGADAFSSKEPLRMAA
jgi:hypothetical protein